MDASATRVLLDSPFAELWNLAAASACRQDKAAFKRLSRLGDEDVDITLALDRASVLNREQASAVAYRLAKHLAQARARVAAAAGRDDGVGRQAAAAVDLFVVAGHSLLVAGPDLGESVVSLFRAGLRADSVAVWGANGCATKVEAKFLAALLDNPVLTFGPVIQSVHDSNPPAVWHHLLGPELLERHWRFIVQCFENAEIEVRDVLASGLGPALFASAKTEAVLARYINERIDEVSGNDLGAAAVGRRLADDWDSGIDLLVDVIRAVRLSSDARPSELRYVV